MEHISFNKSFVSNLENVHVREAISSGKLSGDGKFTKNCQKFFERRYQFRKCLLTTSCTDALEFSALLLNIQQGDEVIVPSFTFVSTANAFVLRGAKIVFADSQPHHPNIDATQIEKLITTKTKAIVPVHYAGVACEMDAIGAIANEYQLAVVEDAALAVDSFFVESGDHQRALGSMGSMSAFSFHDTKSITCGEGGMLVINDEAYLPRAEIIREKGTNRSAFSRGEVDKYGWADVGSSFLPSELNAAFLYAQLESLNEIQARRLSIWNRYYTELEDLADQGQFELPIVPSHSTNNAAIFYIVLPSLQIRSALMTFLKQSGIQTAFHYQALHKSDFAKRFFPSPVALPNAEKYSDRLLRLPLYPDLTDSQVEFICKKIFEFYRYH